MADKKLSELPLASGINANDISLLVSNGADYQFAFASLLQFIGDNLTVGAKISFGTTLPANNSGKNGDLFIKTDTGAFAQKVLGVWTVVYTIPASSGTTDGTILYGVGTPGNFIGSDNDTYINTGNGIFYKKTAGTWSQVFSMQTGPQGPQGTPGINGANGTNGFSLLSGNSIPSNSVTGVNGDFYLNTSTYTLYGPKTAGLWGNGISLISPGLPIGGTSGQILLKSSSTNWDTDWGELSFESLTGDPLDNDDLSALFNTKADLVSGKIPATQLPSYVDDVLEYVNLAGLPATGETGKIYITLNDNAQYRWSGSTYVLLVASPGSTDAVPEGSTNKYFTTSRVLSTLLSGVNFLNTAAVSATDSILGAIGKLQAQINGLLKVPAGGTAGQILAKIDNADGNAEWIDAPVGGIADGLVLGGEASVSGQTVTIHPATWRINGNNYSTVSAEDFLLSDADPVNGRYDVIYGDASGMLHLIEGTTSANPVKPPIPDATIEIAVAYVEPGTISTIGVELANYATKQDVLNVTGEKAELQTDAKGNLVEAVNEVRRKISELNQDSLMIKAFKYSNYK
ncbi:hypothetical protein [Mucilaginibacter auburnensis]|uniref:Collagen triple helix repeat protein n=1 Tax=Mucilaginibacter auburnensis TaxID=1457233 RepID=A0A2H9VNU1_9SPHI|nr:hypothetical protein [Mucilaginibacter auburnensis]PJJ79972.1 hypothetical protein CLV57_3111 [Mucilaginibacter auburnensis]